MTSPAVIDTDLLGVGLSASAPPDSAGLLDIQVGAHVLLPVASDAPREKLVKPPPKQLTKPRTGRSRVLNCESCRIKKMKCDRRNPCANCHLRKIECQWAVEPPSPNTDPSPIRENSTTIASLRKEVKSLAARLNLTPVELQILTHEADRRVQAERGGQLLMGSVAAVSDGLLPSNLTVDYNDEIPPRKKMKSGFNEQDYASDKGYKRGFSTANWKPDWDKKNSAPIAPQSMMIPPRDHHHKRSRNDDQDELEEDQLNTPDRNEKGDQNLLFGLGAVTDPSLLGIGLGDGSASSPDVTGSYVNVSPPPAKRSSGDLAVASTLADIASNQGGQSKGGADIIV